MLNAIKPEDRLGEDYLNHPIFKNLDYYCKFYDSLSISVMCWKSMGTKAILNLDTYTYSSMKGTIESIKGILKNGRINDAYALLRKYYDSTIINVYTNLYLQDNFNIENFVVEHIDNWRAGTSSIPEYRVISKYIMDSSRLSSINQVLNKDKRYKKIRDRCNDHTHYNFYHNILLNDNEIVNSKRVTYLDTLDDDIKDIFIQHYAYVFYLNHHYMMASDYADYLDMGMMPPENAQFFVAPFIQKAFDDIIKPHRQDIVNVIKSETEMQLD